MAQELRLKLGLDNKEFRAKLEESRRALAASLRPTGAVGLGSSFTELFKNFRAVATNAAQVERQLKMPERSVFLKWAAQAEQFKLALGDVRKGIGAVVNPMASLGMAQGAVAQARASMAARAASLRGTVGNISPERAATMRATAALAVANAEERVTKATGASFIKTEGFTKLAKQWTDARSKLDQINKLREEVTERKELARLSKESLQKFDTNAPKSQLGDLSRRNVLLKDYRSELAKLQGAQAKLGALAGGSVGGAMTALKSEIAKSKAAMTSLVPVVDKKAKSEAIAAVDDLAKAKSKLAAVEYDLAHKSGVGTVKRSAAATQMKAEAMEVKAAQKALAAEGAVGAPSRVLGGVLIGLRGAAGMVGQVIMGIAAVAKVAGSIIGAVWNIASTVISAVVSAAKAAFEQLIHLGGMVVKTFGIAAAAVGTALGYAMKQAAAIETQRAAIGALTGDAKVAANIIGQLRQMTLQTPFNLEELAQAARYLNAVGFAGKEIPDVMRTITDAAAGTGKGVLALQEISLALGQIKSKGRLAAEEMTRQLANAGVNAWKYLADATGKSVRDIQEEMKSGVIEASVALPVILNGMKKQFGGAAAMIAATTEGTWRRVGAVLQLVAQQIGEPINRVLTPYISKFVGLLDAAQSPAKAFGEKLAAGLGSAINKMRSAYDEFRKLWNVSGGGLTGFFKAVTGTELFKVIELGLTAAFAKAGEFLVGVLKLVGTVLGEIFKGLAAPGMFAAIGDLLGGAFKGAVAVFLESFRSILPDIAEGLARAVAFAASYLNPKTLVADQNDRWIIENAKARIKGVEANEKEFGSNAWSRGEITSEKLKIHEAEFRMDRRHDTTGAGGDARRAAEKWSAPDNVAKLKTEAQAAFKEAGPKVKAGAEAILKGILGALDAAKLDNDFFKSSEKWRAFVTAWNKLAEKLPGLVKIPELPKRTTSEGGPAPVLRMTDAERDVAKSSLPKDEVARQLGKNATRAVDSFLGVTESEEMGVSDTRKMGQGGGLNYRGMGASGDRPGSSATPEKREAAIEAIRELREVNPEKAKQLYRKMGQGGGQSYRAMGEPGKDTPRIKLPQPNKESVQELLKSLNEKLDGKGSIQVKSDGNPFPVTLDGAITQ